MSLYRTWRPPTFDDLVGQDPVVQTLRTALVRGKLAHAYLFSGPRGSGKTSAAKILARCINCRLGPTPDPDNTCDFCRAILEGTALDVLEIDAASNRGVDSIRELREAVKFAPAQMRMKVYILDEAHMLTTEGSNALLKTLEEPPSHVVFILATTDPDKLLPTILSRCQRYAFGRIPVGKMIERMRTIAAAEGIVVDDGALAAIAYRADGGLRDALTMLEQAATFAEGSVDRSVVEAAFGSSGDAYVNALVAATLREDAGAALRAIDDAAQAGIAAERLATATIRGYRHLLVAQVEPALLARELSVEDAAAIEMAAEGVPPHKLVRALRLLAEVVADRRPSADLRLSLETAVLRLVAAEDASNDGSLASRVAQLEATLARGQNAPARPQPATTQVRPRAADPPKPTTHVAVPTPIPVPTPVPSQAPDLPLTLHRVRQAWRNIRTRAEDERRSLAAPLARAQVDGLEGETLTLVLNDETMAGFLREYAAIVERAVAGVLGAPLRIHVVVGGRGARPEEPTTGSDGTDDELGLLDYARKNLGGERR
ncbi:MAG: DNA polymerase III subunit gamma/tau [Candidatus Baltobacteraceae bacterium]